MATALRSAHALSPSPPRSPPFSPVPFLRCSGLLASLLLLPSLASTLPPDLPDGLYAEIETPHGTLTARLFYQEAPLTVTSFVGLAEGTLGPEPGKPFFDGLTFHRVIPGFVAQGGDPRGDGEGGPGYTFPDEFSPALRHDRIGILSMANDGPDTNGSQFFITLNPQNRLNYLHPVFGAVIDGLDHLVAIEQGDAMTVRIHRLGTDAEAFAATPATLAARSAAVPHASPAYLNDPEQILPSPPDWIRIIGNKLSNLQRATGARLHVLLLSTLPPEETAPSLATNLAQRANITDRGITAVYLADQGTWTLHFATTTQERLIQNDETLTTATERLLTSTEAAAQSALAIRYPDEEPPPANVHKFRLDALLNQLIPLVEIP